MMAFDLAATTNVLRSHVEASGWFGLVLSHEPKSAPRTGERPAASISLWSFGPYPGASGLASTSAIITMMVRLQIGMIIEPQDAIDTAMGLASLEVMRRITADYDLGENVRNVDLMGAKSTGMNMRMGYLDQDGIKFRVSTIMVPCVVNDVWDQSE
jgi:hypothetical protein